MVYTVNMRFEWDEKKAQLNAVNHEITFDQAITVFDDPFALVASDEKHSGTAEIRE